MASAEDYARWIEANADKRGTPEFATVADAYKAARAQMSQPAAQPATMQKSEAEQWGRANPSGVNVAANGALFGFGDEIAAAYKANLETMRGWLPDALGGQDPGAPWKTRYEAHRDYLRGQESAYKDANPYKATALQAVGSIPTMGVAGLPAAGIKGAGLLANMGRAAVSGGVGGLLSGAGNSTADTLGGVAGDAAMGGATGAALGTAAAPVAAAIGSVAKAGMSAVNNTAAAQYAREKLAQQFARDNITGQQAINRLNALGPDASVAMAGREAVMGQLDTLANLPGATRTNAQSAIAQLQKGRGARMTGAADEALGAGGRRAAATTEDLVQQRSLEAKPLYDNLYAMTVPVDQDLAAIIGRADSIGAAGYAKKLAAIDGEAFTLGAKSTQASAKDLDRLKRSIDDAIMSPKGTNAETGRVTELGYSLGKLRAELIAKMDDATGGASAAARSAYAGKSAIIDAVNNGRKALTKDDATIGSLTAGMGASELDGFKVGAFEALRAKLGAQSGQTELMKLWRQDAMKDKLRALFGDEDAFKAFARKMYAEKTMAKMESVVGGSQSANRLANMGDLDTAAISDAGHAIASAGTNPMGLLGTGMRMFNKVSTPEPVRDAMGQILLSRGAAGEKNLQGLLDVIEQANARRAGRAIGTGNIAGRFGAGPLSQYGAGLLSQ
jgi:hypothetical protein